MNYGLNNMLGSANNTNKTQNNAKSKNKFNIMDGLDILSGFKNGKTGGQRLKGIVQAILGGK